MRSECRLIISVVLTAFFFLKSILPVIAAETLQIQVNYTHDWVPGQTDPDASVNIVVTDWQSSPKDWIYITADENGKFMTSDDWDSGSIPDIRPGDNVSVLSAGLGAEINPVGSITGKLDEVNDTVEGFLNIPGIEGTFEVLCEVWEESGPDPISTSANADNGTFSCDFGDVGWDLKKGQTVAVSYLEPDGDRVINILQWPWVRVDYAQDTVGVNYEYGHNFWITVTESDSSGIGPEKGTVKATTTAQTVYQGGWWGEDGFECDTWVPATPDILPGDYVYFVADNGYTNTLHVGEIDGVLSVESDMVTGTVNAPDFSPTLELTVEGHPRGAWDAGLGDVPGKISWAHPDGSDPPFTLDWSSEWDIIPGQEVAVMYIEPDLDRVIDVYREPVPYLKLDMQADGKAAIGGNFLFQIEYWNQGDAPADNVVITTTLQGMSYISDTSGVAHSGSGSEIAWNVGTVAPGMRIKFRLYVEITAEVGNSISSSVQIETSSSYDLGLPSEKQATWQGVVASNDTHLTVEKTALTDDPAPGKALVFGLKICNQGSTASSQMTLTDTLPPGVQYNSWWGMQAGWAEESSPPKILALSIPTIPASTCRGVYIRTLLNETLSPEYTLINQVSIEASNDIELDDNTAVWEGQVGEPHINLMIEKSWQSGQLTPGGELHYIIQYANTGNMPVKGYQDPDGDSVVLAIIETLPVHTSFVEARLIANDSSFPINPIMVTSERVVLQLPDLENGYDGQIEIIADVDQDTQPETTLINTAEICLFNTVDGECLAEPMTEDMYDDNTSMDTQVVHGHGQNLRVSKKHEWLPQQQELNYQIHFENIGDQTVPNVVVRDTYPVGTVFNGEYQIDSDANLSDFSHETSLMIWSFESLEPGQAGTIHFTLALNNPNQAPHLYTNTVEIVPTEDMNPTDNFFSDPAFRRDIGSVHLKLDEQVLLGTSLPGKNVVVTTPQGQFQAQIWECPAGPIYPEDVTLGGCWSIDTVSISPGDTVQIDCDQHTVPIEIPDPFEASASSISDRVFGRIDNLDAENVRIRVGLGTDVLAEKEVKTDNGGNYSAVFDDIPSFCWAEVIYTTYVNYSKVTFHRLVTCDKDTDEDGFPDEVDNCPDTPNQAQTDTDEDTIGDECDNCLLTANKNQEDSNNNGIGDICDTNSDTDNDGLSDAEEVGIYYTSPNTADSDGDGLNDGDEVDYWGTGWNADTDDDLTVNLLDPDADNDGLNDGVEVNVLFTDPALIDTDGDGISDDDEDTDGDGLSNIKEIRCGADPGDPKSKCSKGLPWLPLLLLDD